MQNAVARKPDERKSPAAPEPKEAPELSATTAAGAPAGTPLFLRRWAGGPPPVQREEATEDLAGDSDKEEPVVQARLKVNEPGDAWEREADGVASAVMRKEAGGACPACGAEMPPGIQRKCAACAASDQTCSECEEEEKEETEAVQRKPAAAGPVPTGLSIPVPDSGAPLSGAVRERIEPILGADLSGVRVHSSPAAREGARSLRAKAFTHRDHIWVGPGQSADDVELMAHEAAHVVQQTAGPNGPKPIQRAPADYRHPEDGGSVLGRMRARIEDELGEDAPAVAVAEPAPAPAPVAGGGGVAAPQSAAPPRTVAGPDPEAQRAAQQIDRGELASQKSELTPEARPDVNRPAQEGPQIEAAASATETEAEKPAEPLVEAEGAAAKGEDTGKGKGDAEGAAAAAASLADQAFAMAESQSIPTAEAPVIPPQPAVPVDAGGKPLPADPETDAAIVDLASQAQALRDGGLQMRQQAAEGRTNAGILRGNLEIVRTGAQTAQESIATAEGQVATRREVAGQARQALAVSEQKAATVAAEAPGFQSQADEGKEDSGPMASESAQLAAENRSNTPEDPEAAANAREQGGKIEQVGADAATMDSAITQTKDRAAGLAEEAARAQETNTATGGRLDQVEERLGQTEERLGQMSSQAEQASAQAEAQAGAPDAVAAQAESLDQRGLALIQASFELEQRVQAAQTGYEQGMRSVPAEKPLPEGDGGEGALQREPEDGNPPEPAAAEAPPETAEPGSAEAAPAEGAPVGEVTAPAPTGDRYEDRAQVDLVGGLPSWLTGVDPANERQRQEATQREQQRRADEVALINQWSGGRFEDLSAAGRVGIALRLAGHSAWGSISRISWPGWAGAGRMALHALDPRSTLTGVVSGLSMMLSGGANLLSAEQWRRDPLGNLLKSAADLATGLTIVLGSITALAGLIIAIMTAISILSLGTAAPITGPIIAFCATVMTTVGGWTIAVGQVALVLQALVLIKNLIDAATARTAEDLQAQSDQIRSDVGNMANVAMQVVGARAAQMGGRQLSSAIREAGGGVRFAARMPGQFFGGVRAGAGRLREMGVRGTARAIGGGVRRAGGRAASGVRQGISRGVQAARALPGRVLGGLRAAPGALRSLPGRIAGGVRGIPGRIREGWGRFRQGMSRDFLVGEDIRSFRDAVRAAESEGVRFPGRPGRRGPEFPENAAGREARVAETGHIESRNLTPGDVDAELRHLADNPHLVTGEPPNRRARIGEHTWEEMPGGRWCRHSNGDLCTINPPEGLQRPAETPAPVTPEGAPPPRRRWDDPSLSFDEFLADYRAQYPGRRSTLTDDDLRAHFNSGARLNPETGRLIRPVQPLPVPQEAGNLPPQGHPRAQQWQNYERGSTSQLPCFPAGTLVKTPQGDRRIEELGAGDTVYAYDFQKGSAVARRVLALHRNWTQQLAMIDTAHGQVAATLNHPFWIEDAGVWLAAGDLQQGRMFRLWDGGTTRVVACEVWAAEEDTFNLEIDGNHNYFVGSAGILVHNDTPTAESAFALQGAVRVEIYEVTDVSTGRIVYVGQSVQGVDVRLLQHVNDPGSALFVPRNSLLRNSPDFPNNIFQSRRVAGGNWTPYEAAVWEQHFIDARGENLLNRIDAITEDKFIRYRNLHNPCGRL